MPDPSGRITILIADPDEVVAPDAEKAYNADGLMIVVRRVSERRALLSNVASLNPDVAVIDVMLEGEIGGTVREVLARNPMCTVIVTGTNAHATALSRAVIAGARGFVLKPYRADELVNATRDAYSNTRAFQESMKVERAPAAGPSGAVIVVYSPKGGVGRTTIATYLAVALAARTKTDVALVDLSLQFGDVGVVLDLQSANSVSDFLAHEGAIDQTVIDDIFVRHASGVRVLLAPERVTEAETIDPEKVLKMLGQLRQHFAFTVCDTWSQLDDMTLSALAAADRVVLVTTPELPSLRNLRRVMTDKESLELDRRGLIVVNRYSNRFGVQLPEIESGLGKSVAMTLASEGMAITQAINQGTVLTGRIGDAFGNLADLVVREVGPRHMAMPQLAAVAAS